MPDDEIDRPRPLPGKPIPPVGAGELIGDGSTDAVAGSDWSEERLVDATGDPQPQAGENEAPRFGPPRGETVVGTVSELGSVTPAAEIPPGRARSAAVTDDPRIYVDPQVLARYRARILDPATAVRIGDTPPPRSTVYLGDRLLVGSAQARTRLSEAARPNGLRLVADERREARRRRMVGIAREVGLENAEALFPELVSLEPLPGTAVDVDAWRVLQTFRAQVGVQSDLSRNVTLDHLLTATLHISPVPYDPDGSAPDGPSSSYGRPGWGGRQPVNWLGAAPARHTGYEGRRPVVAVLDTGTGVHSWFDTPGRECVHRNPDVLGLPLGLPEPSGAESSGVVTDPLEGVLDTYSGHGTFIAGLIHQQCPDADILSVRIMPSAGAVAEHTLLDSLSLLLCRQALAQAGGRADLFVDLVNLSLGYYHESPDDEVIDSFLQPILVALGERGVGAIASAGNDATTRPMFPAAFTIYPLGSGSPGGVSMTSVAARNPNGTVALFSNDGPWVTCDEPGADVVSTFPRFNASQQAAIRLERGGVVRETLDEDDFSAGFGVWSGTSFAAPVFAGKVARMLQDGQCGSTAELDVANSVARNALAIATVIDADT